MSLLWKGILIGLIFGVPVGAVGAMTVQRTWEHGIRAGLFTGMGSSVADCIYAGVGAFGLTMVSDFLLEYQTAIHLVGGTLVLLMGIRLLLRKREEAEVPAVSGEWKVFLSSFAVGITNPAAILTFLFAFSWFGIAEESASGKGWLVVLGVFLGTYLWWGGLSAAVALARKKKRTGSFQKMNRIFGTILCLFGILVFLQALPIFIQNGNDAEEGTAMKMNMKVQVGDAVFSATLEENEAVTAFVEMMREGSVAIQMSDYSGFEKVGPLGTSLPASNSQTTTHAGDIVLYNGNQIVIFYGSNSWSYTRLGHIDDLTGWEEALGSKDVTVTFSLE